MKRILLASAFITFLSGVAFTQRMPNPRIPVEYDKFKDITTIIMRGDYVGSLKGNVNSVRFSMLAGYQGQKLTSPASQITIVLTVRAEEWQFLGSTTTLRVILDDKDHMTLGEMLRISSDVKSGHVFEQLSREISLKDLNKLAAAKKIEMQAGNVEFELTDAILTDLKEFADMVAPQQKGN